MEKYQNKYRIPSARLQTWDYCRAGAYFITICIRNRSHCFGEIENDKMILSNIGIIADVIWHEIPRHTINTELDAFVVMPNHIHGIIILTGRGKSDTVRENTYKYSNKFSIVEPGHALALRQPHQPNQQRQSCQRYTIRSTRTTCIMQMTGQKRFQHIGKNSLSSVIGSYKSAVTKHAHRLGLYFEWQTRFYDHIIRDNADYLRIVKYINTNVENWGYDKFNGPNIS